MFYIYRRPREEETKVEPDPSPNSNPIITSELLVPLKYKTQGKLLVREISLVDCQNNSHGKIFPAAGAIDTLFE